MSEPSAVIDVTIAAPVAQVWSALRERDQIRNWHGWVFDGLDQEIDFIYHQHALADDTHHLLRLAGQAPGDFATGDRFELTEVPGGTRLQIVRGPRPPATQERAGYYDDVTEGWTIFAQQLRFALERQPGRARRTVFVSAGELGPEPLATAVGTAGAEPAPFGTPGLPFFADHDRVGAEVPALGPGLVITAAGTGKELLVVSTYGLDDDGFASIVDRVQAFWSHRHPAAAPPGV
ncbi:SRPBCC family protein [Skermania piniformis]|uniref:SRPBCC domain-containing protein n=1 Tax=Skermania pinensis TaxID=39122 RepID=A0ABX8S8M5_9ACTN|nr:hypothetical protein [Skermania piniformis]QXQ14167.1 hypothetical protein KV203_01595 [Skermania piniformis]